MLSANDYVNEHEISIRKKTYFKYCISNLKKLVKSILSSSSKELEALSYGVNYFLLVMMLGAVSLLILKSIGISIFLDENIYYNIRKYIFLVFLAFTFLARFIGHILNKSQIDINKLIIKIFSSIGIIYLNYSYTLYFLKNGDLFSGIEVVVKIILFFNSLLSIYIFDSFSKYKKTNSTYNLKIFDKVNLYFLLLSVFLFLNMNTVDESIYRYIYYSVSILLIEFMVSYVKKIVGYNKLKQNIKFIYEYLLVYYVLTFLIIFGAGYVL
jgi:hypothetical protein